MAMYVARSLVDGGIGMPQRASNMKASKKLGRAQRPS